MEVLCVRIPMRSLGSLGQVEWHLAYHNDTLRNLVGQVGTRLEAWSSLAGPTGQGKLGRSSTGDPTCTLKSYMHVIAAICGHT